MSKFHIGDKVQLREVTITDIRMGCLDTPFYTVEQGWYITQDKLDTMIHEPVTAPVHGIGDYFPMVARKVSKYDGMTDSELRQSLCEHGTSCSSGRKMPCPLRSNTLWPFEHCAEYIAAHPFFRPTLIAYLEAEDAAGGKC